VGCGRASARLGLRDFLWFRHGRDAHDTGSAADLACAMNECVRGCCEKAKLWLSKNLNVRIAIIRDQRTG
jgi:hypothetical protein